MTVEVFDNLEVVATCGWQLGKGPHAVNIAFCAFQATPGCCEPDLRNIVILVL